MKYFTNAPATSFTVMDLPPFMQGKYNDKKPLFDTAYMLKLARWAELEYSDTIAFLCAINNEKALRRLLSVKPYIAQAHIVAETKEFSQAVKYMDDKTWQSYPAPLRKFLAECYKIYESSLKK